MQRSRRCSEGGRRQQSLRITTLELSSFGQSLGRSKQSQVSDSGGVPWVSALSESFVQAPILPTRRHNVAYCSFAKRQQSVAQGFHHHHLP